jgi:hypothetical protein
MVIANDSVNEASDTWYGDTAHKYLHIICEILL